MRYSIYDVRWLDHKWDDYLMATCPFPETLHHESWMAMYAFFIELIGDAEFIDWFITVDSALMPLAYCIISNW